jgi:hypothetical protein
MLLMGVRRRRQNGQALLVVLAFLAAFMLLIWASLRLASDAFLGLNSVRADTRSTYALDAGVAYGQQYAHWLGGVCMATFSPPTFTLNYPPGITVAVTITRAPGCTGANPAYNLAVSATGTSRTVRAQVYQSNVAPNPWFVRWAQYQ